MKMPHFESPECVRAIAEGSKDLNDNDDPAHVDGLRLNELNVCTAAPYHLVNATVNLPSTELREMRGRNGDFFLFSKHFCGSPMCGYHPTTDLEEADPHLDLGTAMAISCAAESSNMGWKTENALRLVMTLANMRLGYGPGYVMDYKHAHPEFPHQSTANQIYDEAQFEAYRALGEAAAESFFSEELINDCQPRNVESWFTTLASALLPDNDEAFVKKEAAHHPVL